MAPKKKICGCPPLRPYVGRDYHDTHHTHHRCKDAILHHVHSRTHRPNIAELVYKFLGNVASMSAVRRQEKNAQNNFNRTHVRKSRCHHRRPDVPHKSEGIFDPQGLCPRSADHASTVGTDPSSVPPKTSSITKSFVKQRSSIQVIKDYIKAGIEEGKRRAKKYMCKALSFGVDSGYLIPTDSEGQVLRVSSALADFDAQQKDNERRRRQTMRRGTKCGNSQDRKSLRGRYSNLTRKRTRSRTPSHAPPLQRARRKKLLYKKRIRKHRSRKVKTPKRGRGRRPKRGPSPSPRGGDPDPDPDPEPDHDDNVEPDNDDPGHSQDTNDIEEDPKNVPSAPSDQKQKSVKEEGGSGSSNGEGDSDNGEKKDV